MPFTNNMQDNGLPHHSNDPPYVEFDANLDNDDDTIDNAPHLTDPNPLDAEFYVINTFINSLIVAAPPRRHAMTLVNTDLPDRCLDMSAYCTQNAHSLCRLAMDSEGNKLR